MSDKNILGIPRASLQHTWSLRTGQLIVFTGVVLACLVSGASAQESSRVWAVHSPSTQYGDEAILLASTEDIMTMRPYEIDAFAHALADCQAVYLNDDSNVTGVCTRSWNYFLLIYSRPDSAVGQLAASVRTVWSFLQSEQKSGKKDSIAGSIARFKLIRDKWADAVRRRYAKM